METGETMKALYIEVDPTGYTPSLVNDQVVHLSEDGVRGGPETIEEEDFDEVFETLRRGLRFVGQNWEMWPLREPGTWEALFFDTSTGVCHTVGEYDSPEKAQAAAEAFFEQIDGTPAIRKKG